MDKRWYVLYVSTGQEREILKRLEDKGIEAIVPIENRLIRQKGQWVKKPYVVFPSYVFVHIRYSWGLYYEMVKISGVIQLLSDSCEPTALTDEEAALLLQQQECFSEPSVIRLTDNGFEVVSGALVRLKDRIRHIDRHARRVTVSMKLAGRETAFTLSFVKQ